MRNRKQNNGLYDVIIIGAGPAGLTAAIYASRAGLKTLLFGIPEESNIYRASVVDNYFGTGSVAGRRLIKLGLDKALGNGAEFAKKTVVNASRDKKDIFKITDSDNNQYRSKTIIICTGLGFKPSGIKNEQQFISRGVSYCVTCDGPFFKGKKLAVIGNANFAGCEALHLKVYSDNIMILSNGNDFNFSFSMNRELKTKNISLRKTVRIKEFAGDKKLKSIVYADGVEEKFDGVFMALGVAGASDFAAKLGLGRCGPQNAFLVADARSGKTNIPGVYAAGDCAGGHAQVAKSAGEGCNAAISVIEFLKGISKYADYC